VCEPVLERLRADHAAALLAFERDNRNYFAASVPDRGDEYFAAFDDRHRTLLAWQDEGTDHFHVLVEPDGSIVGRVNLADVTDGSAELGYRIAERAAGRGLATAAVRRVVELARRTDSPRCGHGPPTTTPPPGGCSNAPASSRPARSPSTAGPGRRTCARSDFRRGMSGIVSRLARGGGEADA
jgi:Acetyltransferase (GNAT) domain